MAGQAPDSPWQGPVWWQNVTKLCAMWMPGPVVGCPAPLCWGEPAGVGGIGAVPAL